MTNQQPHAQPTNTPLTSSAEDFVPHLIGAVMLDRPVSLAELAGHLAEHTPDKITIGDIKELADGAGMIFGVNGRHLIRLITVDGPLQDAMRPAVHPILTAPVKDELDKVAGQVLVSLEPVDLKPEQYNREIRFDQLMTHAFVTGAVASLPGTIAVHNVQGSTTIAAAAFQDALDKDIYPTLLCPVWLTQTAQGFTGYTYGLHQAGHPELQAKDSSTDPTELYFNLMNLADYVLSGQTLSDGHTLSFGEGKPSHTATKDQWVVDQKIPAFTIDF